MTDKDAAHALAILAQIQNSATAFLQNILSNDGLEVMTDIDMPLKITLENGTEFESYMKIRVDRFANIKMVDSVEDVVKRIAKKMAELGL